MRDAGAEGEEVGVDDEVVNEVFLHYAHDFVVVGFGETLEGGLFDDVGEI